MLAVIERDGFIMLGVSLFYILELLLQTSLFTLLAPPHLDQLNIGHIIPLTVNCW